MKTIPAYYEYSSGEPYEAAILEISAGTKKTALILDRTIFYPEGGGQSADQGAINGVPLLDVQEQEGEILHFVDTEAGAALKPGPAELRLNAARRRDFTVQHTAQHLLSGTLLRLTRAYTVSMRLGEELCTIDVEAQNLGEEALLQVEEAVANAIEADCPVIIHHCPPENIADFPLRKVPPQGEEIIRVVEIRGHDFSPCCGTHLQSTGQIGLLRILGAEKYKAGSARPLTRLSFIAGRRLLQDSRMLRRNGEIISRALKTPLAETGRGVLALQEKINQLERNLKALQDEAAQGKAEALLRKAGLDALPGAANSGKGRLLVERFPGLDMEEILRIGRAAQKLTVSALVLASEQEGKFAAFCSAPGADLRSVLKGPMEARGGKGGGGPSFFQGLFASPGELAAFLDALPGTMV